MRRHVFSLWPNKMLVDDGDDDDDDAKPTFRMQSAFVFGCHTFYVSAEGLLAYDATYNIMQ